MPKTVDLALLATLTRRAAAAPRLRCNHNLHPQLDDPVQRFLNAIEPGSYVRPHRHSAADGRWELFVILAGRAAVLLFDDDARVRERIELAAGGPTLAIEIPAGAWHGLVALAPATVLFEFKQGPYAPLSDKDFAPWAPAEGDPACAALCARFASARVGECCAPG